MFKTLFTPLRLSVAAANLATSLPFVPEPLHEATSWLDDALKDGPISRYFVGSVVCKLTGWEYEGGVPQYPKLIVVGAPHTSNWDAFYFLAVAFRADLDSPKWAAKKEIFSFPLGPLFKALGGIPIERAKAGTNYVDHIAKLFEQAPNLWLFIAAEGTRKRAERWKTGFYYIAMKADVPIALSYLDYERKRGGIGMTFFPTGDIEADFEKFADFYADKVALYPEKFGPVRPFAPAEKNKAPTNGHVPHEDDVKISGES